MVNKIISFFMKKPIHFLLLALPLAVIAEAAHWSALAIFALSAAGVIPLAGLIGEATEVLAHKTGPKIGGLLNATLGNAAELIITLIAIRAGLLELVKASITGSILGNLLLVLGMSLLLGGLKNGSQKYDRRQAGSNAILLTLSVLALVIPSLFSFSIGGEGSAPVEYLSLGVAGVMILLYALGLIYSLKVNNSPVTHQPEPSNSVPHWSVNFAILMLALSTLGVVLMSEILVGAVEEVTASLGLSEFFLGIILIPLVGNVAEHLVAVEMAIRNKMDLSVEIAVSSSLQIALFVAPLLVFVSLWMGNPLTLIFNQFELLAVGAAVLITALVSGDGESNWLEGASLLAVYFILGLAFFMLPA